MHSGFPLDDVKITRLDHVTGIEGPCHRGINWQSSANEYALQVEGLGSFRSMNGNMIMYSVKPGADPGLVDLFLNSQLLVSILHQRSVISFHAGSFVYRGKGVMIPGETGAGKTSLTFSFAQNGAGFIADDLTPVIFSGSTPLILPLHRKSKLRKGTAEMLGIDPSVLTETESGTGKMYLDQAPAFFEPVPLDMIVHLETGQAEKPMFSIPSPAERFALMRSNICNWEILAGMPDTEKAYLQQLTSIVEHADFIKVTRPLNSGIKEFHETVKAVIDERIPG